MYTKITRIISIVEKAPSLYITTILDGDGNEASGVGKDFKEGEEIVVWFHDKYNKAKFMRPKNYEPDQLEK